MRPSAGASVLTFSMVLAACTATGSPASSGPSGPGVSASPSPSVTTSPSVPGSSPAAYTGGQPSDEPCSRPIDLAAVPASDRVRPDDLERMVLSRDDLGGLPGFEADVFGHGFIGNAELLTVEVHPSTTCDDIQRLGRLTGFAESFLETIESGVPDRVTTTAHLFRDEAGARAWVDAFIAGFESTRGDADGPTTFDVGPLPGGEAGDRLVTHVGPDGTRTWAIVVRGPVVGWVVDLHRGQKTTIDVAATAARLAERIGSVMTEVASRPPSGLDVAAMLFAPLPLAAYGSGFAGLTWDPVFGGCTDIVERGYIAGDEAAEDARTFGRVSGCTSMYAPEDPTSGDVERVFSALQVMRDADGASAALAKSIADMEAHGGTVFELTGLGDETAAIRTPPAGERTSTDTRVLVRTGPYLSSVVIQDRAGGDRSALVVDLARDMTGRVAAAIEAGSD